MSCSTARPGFWPLWQWSVGWIAGFRDLLSTHCPAFWSPAALSRGCATLSINHGTAKTLVAQSLYTLWFEGSTRYQHPRRSRSDAAGFDPNRCCAQLFCSLASLCPAALSYWRFLRIPAPEHLVIGRGVTATFERRLAGFLTYCQQLAWSVCLNLCFSSWTIARFVSLWYHFHRIVSLR